MTEKKGNIFSGMRPTGRLHLGHYSVLENWRKLQDEYNCYYGIVDWHALTTAFEDTTKIKDNIREMALDWLSVGLDPEKSAIFVQSSVKEHSELYLQLSMITPVSWLERVPTYKEQINQFSKAGKDISTHGFMGYPVLMAADILIYQATVVPVGEDQLPHLEFCREIARRFNHMFQTNILPEPQALLGEIKLLPGIDNRKMSKSYNNEIVLGASQTDIKNKVNQMVTDPARVKKDDPGHPDICAVYTYHKFYNKAEVPQIEADCRNGCIGCVACKNRLVAKLDEFMSPIREKREFFAAKPGLVDEVLAEGSKKAHIKAAETMNLIREAMHI